MNADRDYFAGCHNVPMFADGELVAGADRCAWPSSDHPIGHHAATLAEYVRTIDARRVVRQLELPAELLPRADGQLFS